MNLRNFSEHAGFTFQAVCDVGGQNFVSCFDL